MRCLVILLILMILILGGCAETVPEPPDFPNDNGVSGEPVATDNGVAGIPLPPALPEDSP